MVHKIKVVDLDPEEGEALAEIVALAKERGCWLRIEVRKSAPPSEYPAPERSPNDPICGG